ncbi:MAG: hypothetical protein O9289_15255 [Rhodobacteraceae bacterium]|nr:hypothetical protein [Paracoccaceae bacterium]MCZ8084552.1 hypothetical protein [Paracoccaceae bacterium]
MIAALHLDPIGRAGRAMSAMPAPLSQACAVRLIDRRTGQTHRINGSPLVLFTKSPDEAVAELLSGRDAAVWEARVEPIGTAPRKNGGRE